MATAGIPTPCTPSCSTPDLGAVLQQANEGFFRLQPAIRPTRRHATPEQGRALEILGHAVEYLVDSRLFLIDQPASSADHDATRLLMQSSRNLFSECAEVVPIADRIRLWMHSRLPSRVN